MTSDTERERELRRLLAEAVEPVEPGPGAQTRLLARAHARAHRRKSRGPLVLRWAVPVTLASLIVIAVVTLAFAIHAGERSNSATSSAGSAAASAPPRAADSSGGSATSGAPARPPSPEPLSGEVNDGKRVAGSTFSEQSGTHAPRALADINADAAPDSLTVTGADLTATLSGDGVQTVSLPPPVGVGARVLGVTTLSDPSGKPVSVVFVRLTEAGAAATDTVVSVVGGRLTVLRQGADPVLLTIDPTHGYGCNQRSLALAGNTTPFVVEGTQLVASPQLRGVVTPAGKTTGCF